MIIMLRHTNHVATSLRVYLSSGLIDCELLYCYKTITLYFPSNGKTLMGMVLTEILSSFGFFTNYHRVLTKYKTIINTYFITVTSDGYQKLRVPPWYSKHPDRKSCTHAAASKFIWASSQLWSFGVFGFWTNTLRSPIQFMTALMVAYPSWSYERLRKVCPQRI